MKLSRTLTVAGLALAASAMIGTGVASADPSAGLLGNSALFNTTCNYDQLHRALATADPQTTAALDAQPAAQAQMRQFLALSPAQRHAMVDQAMASQGVNTQQLAQQHPQQVAHMQSVVTQATNTCHRY